MMRLKIAVSGLALCLLSSAPSQAEGPATGRFARGGILIPIPTRTANLATSGLPIVSYGSQRSPAPLPQGRTVAATGAPGQQCREAIRIAEQGATMPAQLMAAIARVESGRPDAQGVVHPWPWTINAEGVGHYYDSKADAIAAVRALQARGVRSVDVGCMQVNLMYHPDAFASLEQAFDPVANARYAADFLTRLYGQTHDWTKATAYYHSATPELGDSYQRKVAAVMPDEMRHLGGPAGVRPNVWSVNAWTANAWNTGAPAAFNGRAGGFMLNNRSGSARVIPLPQGATGRGLAAYRRNPVPMVATR